MARAGSLLVRGDQHVELSALHVPPTRLDAFERLVLTNLKRCVSESSNTLIVRAEIEEMGSTVLCSVAVHESFAPRPRAFEREDQTVWELQVTMKRQQVLFEVL